ncbi:hypothetical protein BB560_005010, partial [Smittium megazygosporum]
MQTSHSNQFRDFEIEGTKGTDHETKLPNSSFLDNQSKFDLDPHSIYKVASDPYEVYSNTHSYQPTNNFNMTKSVEPGFESISLKTQPPEVTDNLNYAPNSMFNYNQEVQNSDYKNNHDLEEIAGIQGPIRETEFLNFENSLSPVSIFKPSHQNPIKTSLEPIAEDPNLAFNQTVDKFEPYSLHQIFLHSDKANLESNTENPQSESFEFEKYDTTTQAQTRDYTDFNLEPLPKNKKVSNIFFELEKKDLEKEMLLSKIVSLERHILDMSSQPQSLSHQNFDYAQEISTLTKIYDARVSELMKQNSEIVKTISGLEDELELTKQRVYKNLNYNDEFPSQYNTASLKYNQDNTGFESRIDSHSIPNNLEPISGNDSKTYERESELRFTLENAINEQNKLKATLEEITVSLEAAEENNNFLEEMLSSTLESKNSVEYERDNLLAELEKFKQSGADNSEPSETNHNLNEGSENPSFFLKNPQEEFVINNLAEINQDTLENELALTKLELERRLTQVKELEQHNLDLLKKLDTSKSQSSNNARQYETLGMESTVLDSESSLRGEKLDKIQKELSAIFEKLYSYDSNSGSYLDHPQDDEIQSYNSELSSNNNMTRADIKIIELEQLVSKLNYKVDTLEYFGQNSIDKFEHSRQFVPSLEQEIKTLNEEIESLNQEIKSKNESLEETKSKLNDAIVVRDQNKIEMEALLNKVQSLELGLVEGQLLLDKSTTSEQQHSQTGPNLTALSESENQLHGIIKQLEEQVLQLELKERQKGQLLEELSREIDVLKEYLEDARNKNIELKGNLDSANNDLYNYQKSSDSTGSELTRQITESPKQIELLQQSAQNLETEKQELLKSLEAVKSEIKLLSETKQDLEFQLKTSENKYYQDLETLNSEISHFKLLLNDKENISLELSKKSKDLERDLNEKINQLNEVESQLGQSANEIDAYKQKVNGFDSLLGSKNAEIANLIAEFEDKSRLYNEATGRFESESKSKNEEISNLRQRVLNLEAEVAVSKESFGKTENEKNIQILSLEKAMNELDEKYKDLMTQNTAYIHESSLKDKRVLALEDNITDLSRSLDGLNLEIIKLKSENEQLSLETNQLNKSLFELQELLKEKEATLNDTLELLNEANLNNNRLNICIEQLSNKAAEFEKSNEALNEQISELKNQNNGNLQDSTVLKNQLKSVIDDVLGFASSVSSLSSEISKKVENWNEFSKEP